MASAPHSGPGSALNSAPETLIRSVGLKATPGRIRVLTALQAASQPLSHAEVEAGIAGKDNKSIDRVTLYRILDSLVACGLLLKAVDARGVFRFSASTAHRQHQSHLHFRCTGCGAVFCLPGTPPTPPELPAGFRLGAMVCDISGVCSGCDAPQ